MTNQDLLQERTSRLITFIRGLIVFAMGVVCAWALFSATADEQDRRMTEQLNKCRGGNFCRLDGETEQFRFLTISRRAK